MMIINREGQLIANYWKWYLYIVDEEFYQPGQEYVIIEL
jgi:predicted amidohydrolase